MTIDIQKIDLNIIILIILLSTSHTNIVLFINYKLIIMIILKKTINDMYGRSNA